MHLGGNDVVDLCSFFYSCCWKVGMEMRFVFDLGAALYKASGTFVFSRHRTQGSSKIWLPFDFERMLILDYESQIRRACPSRTLRALNFLV